MWNLIKMLRYASTAIWQCNFDYNIARMFQRASKEFGVSTIIGPHGGSNWYPGLVGLYYPNKEEQKRGGELKAQINERFYEFQRNPIRMWA